MAKPKRLENVLDARQKRMLATKQSAKKRASIAKANLIAGKTLMQRQQKGVHQRSGK